MVKILGNLTRMGDMFNYLNKQDINTDVPAFGTTQGSKF